MGRSPEKGINIKVWGAVAVGLLALKGGYINGDTLGEAQELLGGFDLGIGGEPDPPEMTAAVNNARRFWIAKGYNINHVDVEYVSEEEFGEGRAHYDPGDDEATVLEPKSDDPNMRRAEIRYQVYHELAHAAQDADAEKNNRSLNDIPRIEYELLADARSGETAVFVGEAADIPLFKQIAARPEMANASHGTNAQRQGAIQMGADGNANIENIRKFIAGQY